MVIDKDSDQNFDKPDFAMLAYLRGLDIARGRRVPVVLQSEVSECAAACLSMVAGYHGLKTDLAIARGWLPQSGLGISVSQLADASGKIHLSSRAMRATMTGLGGLVLPAILHWNLDHFVVLTKISRRWLWINDPAVGPRRLSVAEASGHFTGIALELSPAKGFKSSDERSPLRLRDFTGELVGFRRAIAHLFGLSLAIELFGLCGPALSQAVIDNVAISGNTGLLATLMSAMLALLIIGVAVQYFRSWVILRFSTHWNLQWTGNVFRHMLDLRPNYYEKRQVGDIVSRFGSVSAIQQALSTDLIASILDGLMASITLVVIFFYSRPLALVVLGGVFLSILIKLLSYGTLKRYSMEGLRAQSVAGSLLIESIRGMRIFKLFGARQRRLDMMLNRQVDAMNPGIRSSKLEMAVGAADTVIIGVQRLLLIGLGAYIIQAGNMSLGMLFAFLSYSDQFCSRILSLVSHLLKFRMLRVHIDRLSDIVLEPAETADTPNHPYSDAEPEPSTNGRQDAPDIEFRNVSFRYAANQPFVFENVSFEVALGEWVVMTGQSGAGKSSLAKLLLRLEYPSGGQILIKGHRLQDMPLEELRHMFGAVLQEDLLLMGSVADNITMFDTSVKDKGWLEACADAAQIGGFIRQLPMGFATPIDESGSSLSAGQRQRLMIARALYKRPRILLLDEASSHLDVDTERLLNAALKSMHITRLVFAHRPETIAAADRRLHLPDLSRPSV